MDIDIDFTQPKSYGDNIGRGRSRRNFDWRANAEKHSSRAYDIGLRFFSELDLTNTTDEQDDILKLSILYGTNVSCCINSEDLSAGHHMHEFSALDYIEADEGWEEELILEVIHNGLMGSSGFINNPAREWRRAYLYKHLEELLDIHDNFKPEKPGDISKFESLCNGVIDLWIHNIENYEYTIYVCLNNSKKTIRQMFFEIDKNEQRTTEHGGIPYTFRQYWEHWHNQQGESPQDVVDRWESSYINWTASGFNFNGGKKKNKNKVRTLKRIY
tara:strand:- start:594 stop:1409 length:816 start_codon:yes stop_codon:yes gene_type:complete